MEHTCRNVICCLQKTIEELAEEGGGGGGEIHTPRFDHGRPDRTRGTSPWPTSNGRGFSGVVRGNNFNRWRCSFDVFQG